MAQLLLVLSEKMTNTADKRVKISEEEVELLVNALQFTCRSWRGKEAKKLHDLIKKIRITAKMSNSVDVKDP